MSVRCSRGVVCVLAAGWGVNFNAKRSTLRLKVQL